MTVLSSIDGLGPYIVPLLLRSLVLSIIGLLVLWSLRKQTPALRHLAWTALLVALLAIPFLGPIARSVEQLRPVSDLRQNAASDHQASQLLIFQPVSPRPQAPDRLSEFAATVAPILSTCWFAGAVGLLLHWAFGLVIIGRVRRSSVSAQSDSMQQELSRCADLLGLGDPVTVLLSNDDAKVPTPAALGLWRPSILLPHAAERWSKEELVPVLLHELAHIKRRDVLARHLAAICRAVHWPNPIVWFAVREIPRESERACDDLALGHLEVRPSGYARRLLQLARESSNPESTDLPLASMVGSQPKELEKRIMRILDPTAARSTLPKRSKRLTLSLAIALALGVGFLGADRWPQNLPSMNIGGPIGAEPPSTQAPRSQVLIDARIVESTEEFVDWSFAVLQRAARGDVSDLVKVAGAQSLDQALEMLEEQGKLKILSAPKIITLDGEDAAIQSGLQVPIQTTNDEGTSVQFVNATLRLDLVPRIRDDGSIELELELQKRYPTGGSLEMTAGRAPIQTSETTSSMVVADGGTVALAGMDEDDPIHGSKRMALFLTAKVLNP